MGLGKKRLAILERAMEHIRTVPYKVSVRWVFYRLLDDGIYTKKSQFKTRFGNLIADARNDGHISPDTFSDETRSPIIRGTGFDGNLERIAEYMARQDKFQNQDYYLEIWYEARAMTPQFLRYTEYITLVPCGGFASITYKHEIAKRLESVDKPVKILYFGDLDEDGKKIYADMRDSVQRWCDRHFEIERCGLTEDQALKYGLPPEDGYQWESLTDQQAREIFDTEISKFFSHAGISEILEDEERQKVYWLEKLTG